ncbi:SRPBCC family protein [Patulibacter brassicae]|jgi:uncharacterized protein YndB with AHSA1/START domain|uniref:SRPBCC family protein n=1 Tax=Patulibacter brassicae TaxID=1705717 RepID=A0ABU4VJX0_9ACTN|nr:SRPBCC family protein [Patulibacter brassicae]MDX8151173.1 SRPBCC family protein [Patulibacter brassicae]
MSAVVVFRDLPATPERVWEVVMDPHQFGAWVTIQDELLSADEGAPRVGFAMAQRYVIRGAKVKVSWKLRELDPPRWADWHGKGPAGAKAFISYRLEPLPQEDGTTHTRFHYSNEFRAPMGPLGAVASKALMGGVPEREAHASLDRLAALLAG